MTVTVDGMGKLRADVRWLHGMNQSRFGSFFFFSDPSKGSGEPLNLHRTSFGQDWIGSRSSFPLF